jgi:hypothetical protein
MSKPELYTAICDLRNPIKKGEIRDGQRWKKSILVPIVLECISMQPVGILCSLDLGAVIIPV